MNIGKIYKFVNELKMRNIKIPKDIIFICSDFEEYVPNNLQKYILIEVGGCNIISEKVINKFIKENAKL